MSRKILIVDDEPDIVEFEKAILVRRDYVVFTASNSKDAIAIIMKESPDIVLCDIKMETELTGLELLERSKKINPGITFVLITGIMDPRIESQCRTRGAKDIWIKPLSSKELMKRLAS